MKAPEMSPGCKLISQNLVKQSTSSYSNTEDIDDDIVILEQHSPNKPKSAKESSPVPDDPQIINQVDANLIDKSGSIASNSKLRLKELTSHSTLLDRLEEYVKMALNNMENVDRKLLDTLLAAINIQVQREPYSVRKLILEKQLVLPNAIIMPPSQVVEAIIEHDPEHQLSKIINKLFGEERPKLTENDKKERQALKATNPAPNMARLLVEIGQDIVQEATYYDIVYARNLPETPKNMDAYKQVASQLKPIWESLKAKNESFRLKILTCSLCNFKTTNQMVLNVHRQTLHYNGRKYQCTFCPEYDTNENRITQHYLEVHQLKPLQAETLSTKIECPICDQDFSYKGHRDTHLKICRRDVNKIRTVQAGRAPEHISVINRWLWDKPPIEQSLIAQQQNLQRQQQQVKQQQPQQRMTTANSINVIKQVYQNAGKKRTSYGSPCQSDAALQQQMLIQQRLKLMQSSTTSNLSQNPVVNVKNIPLSGNIQPANLALQLRLHQQRQPQPRQQLQAQPNQYQYNRNLQRPQMKQTFFSTNNSTLSLQGVRTSMPAIMMQKCALPQQILSKQLSLSSGKSSCEICDKLNENKEHYLKHLQETHKQMQGKVVADMTAGAPLACSRCRDRFWTYEGLERHLLMDHGLVTNDLLQKAQKLNDSGFCKKCGKMFAFNLVQHLAKDHNTKLCSAEIMYSCDVCAFKCSCYQDLEKHLKLHPKNK